MEKCSIYSFFGWFNSRGRIIITCAKLHLTSSSIIPERVIKDVLKFYESTDVSRICLGNSDCMSMRQRKQSKLERQKHFILWNLKEAYTNFKQKYPNHKIVFPKFADLRLKWWVLAGRTGTDSVCVCKIHKNNGISKTIY